MDKGAMLSRRLAEERAVIALYYPQIAIPDVWVREAILFWDTIQRIVPTHYRSEDDSPILQGLLERRIVRNVAPGPHLEPVVRQLPEFLNRFGNRLSQRFSLRREGTHFVDPLGDEVFPFTIYTEKFPGEMSARLVDFHLAMNGHDQIGDFLHVHPRVAAVYLTSLAHHIARENRVSAVTSSASGFPVCDNLNLEVVGRELLNEPTDVATSAELPSNLSRAITLAFNAAVPVIGDDVSIDDILSFKKKYGEELRSFQSWSNELSSELAERIGPQTDEGARQDHLEDFMDTRIKPQLENAEKIFKSAFGVMTRSLVCMRVPVLPAVIALPMTWGQVDVVSGTTASAALFGATTLADARRGLLASVQANPASYLLRIRDEMSPRTFMERAALRIRRFATGI